MRALPWCVLLLGGVLLAHRPSHAQQPADSGRPAHPADSSERAAHPPDSTVGQRPTPQRRAFYLYLVPTSEKLTGFKLTLVAAFLWRTALDGITRPSADFHHSAYTANHQLLIGFGGDSWTPRNTRHINFGIEYTKFPAPFFGIGPRTPESAQELYTPRTLALGVMVQREIRPHAYAQLALHLRHESIVGTVPGGLLSADTIAGSTGYTRVAPELGLVLDSRDLLFEPERGAFVDGHIRLDLPPLGGSAGYQTYLLDARFYRQVRPGSVLALQAAFAGASGTVPFQELPQLGGSELRAYVYGRWRDRVALWEQVEWRQHVVWRVGVVGFLAAGAIGPGIGSLGPVRTTYGTGFRFNLSTKKNANFSMARPDPPELGQRLRHRRHVVP
jgi:hypothetical protein